MQAIPAIEATFHQRLNSKELVSVINSLPYGTVHCNGTLGDRQRTIVTAVEHALNPCRRLPGL
jgi:hypothetical protein